MTQNSEIIKVKSGKFYYIEIFKKHLHGKKKQSQKTNNKLENIFTTYITTKSLTSHIYKELLEVLGKKTKNPTEKWVEGTSQTYIKMALKHMKTRPTSLVIGQM